MVSSVIDTSEMSELDRGGGSAGHVAKDPGGNDDIGTNRNRRFTFALCQSPGEGPGDGRRSDHKADRDQRRDGTGQTIHSAETPRAVRYHQDACTAADRCRDVTPAAAAARPCPRSRGCRRSGPARHNRTGCRPTRGASRGPGPADCCGAQTSAYPSTRGHDDSAPDPLRTGADSGNARRRPAVSRIALANCAAALASGRATASAPTRRSRVASGRDGGPAARPDDADLIRRARLACGNRRRGGLASPPPVAPDRRDPRRAVAKPIARSARRRLPDWRPCAYRAAPGHSGASPAGRP